MADHENGEDKVGEALKNAGAKTREVSEGVDKKIDAAYDHVESYVAKNQSTLKSVFRSAVKGAVAGFVAGLFIRRPFTAAALGFVAGAGYRAYKVATSNNKPSL